MKRLFVLLFAVLLAALLPGCEQGTDAPATSGTEPSTSPVTAPVTAPVTGVVTLPPVTEPPVTEPAVPTLKFSSRGDGTCTVNGLGTCKDITDLVIPSVSPSGDTVTGFGYGGLKNSKNLVSVVVPDTVTSIMWWTFSGCTSLERVVLPAGITEILSYGFNNCSSLKEINFKGTEAQWNAIAVTPEGNELLDTVKVNFNYTEDVSVQPELG